MPKRIAAVERTEAGRQDAGAYFSRGLHALRRILTLHHRPSPPTTLSYEEARCDLASTLSNSRYRATGP